MTGHLDEIMMGDVFAALDAGTKVTVSKQGGCGTAIYAATEGGRPADQLRFRDTGTRVPITRDGPRFYVWVEDERPEHERLLDGVELPVSARGTCELCAVKEVGDGSLWCWVGAFWALIPLTRVYQWAHRAPADALNVVWFTDASAPWLVGGTSRPCAVALWLPKEERT